MYRLLDRFVMMQTKYIGPSRGASDGAGTRWAQDDKSGVGCL
jgi:hypothetical protein